MSAVFRTPKPADPTSGRPRATSCAWHPTENTTKHSHEQTPPSSSPPREEGGYNLRGQTKFLPDVRYAVAQEKDAPETSSALLLRPYLATVLAPSPSWAGSAHVGALGSSVPYVRRGGPQIRVREVPNSGSLQLPGRLDRSSGLVDQVWPGLHTKSGAGRGESGVASQGPEIDASEFGAGSTS